MIEGAAKERRLVIDAFGSLLDGELRPQCLESDSNTRAPELCARAYESSGVLARCFVRDEFSAKRDEFNVAQEGRSW